MVIESRFIWLHFGKTAGTSVRSSLIKLFPHAKTIDDSNPFKHLNHTEALNYGIKIPIDRPIAVGFRQLATWSESHLYQQFGDNIPDEAKIRTINGEFILGSNSLARKKGMFSNVNTLDELIDYYHGNLSPYIMRQEFLINDFINFFSLFIPEFEKKQFEKLFQIKKNARQIQKGNLFNANEIKQLYLSSPKWTEIEKKLYK